MIDVAPTIAQLWGESLADADGLAVNGIYRGDASSTDDPLGFKMGN